MHYFLVQFKPGRSWGFLGLGTALEKRIVF